MIALRRYGIAFAGWLGLALLILAVLPFALYAVEFGLGGAGVVPATPSRFFSQAAPVASAGIALHMVAGGAMTVLAPLQLLGPVRRRWPAAHRWLGRGLVAMAIVTGLGGLVFIAGRGTIGGGPMNAGFAVYGLAMTWSAALAWRFARDRDFDRHRRWALRLFVLILGSWLYRVMYGLWELAADGAGSRPDFGGPFDLVMVWTCYLQWLPLLELRFLAERRAGARA